MFDRLFEKEVKGVLKAMTLEWVCLSCAGTNFQLPAPEDRGSGMHHDRCQYCRTKYRVSFPQQAGPLEGEAIIQERLSSEHFTAEEQQELIRDFAEVEYMRADNANPREVTGKQRMLEEKIVFFTQHRRMEHYPPVYMLRFAKTPMKRQSSAAMDSTP